MGRVAIVVLVLTSACGGRIVRFEAPNGKAADLSHSAFDSLLARYVDERGRVDYERWHASAPDIARLDAYLAGLASASPRNHPELFAHRAQELTYWVNLYNALVVREVLRHWPLDSVGDIQPTLASKLIPRRGFFRDTKFAIGGVTMSLDDIEHEVIRKTFADARLHFAINCGSASCPILRSYGGDVDAQLDRAARGFINDPSNVSVDPKRKTIHLSKLFDWYERDFVADARRRTGRHDAGVIDFLLLYADTDLARALTDARRGEFRVAHVSYDWSINRGDIGTGRGPRRDDPRVGHQLDDTRFSLLDGGQFRLADHRGKVVIIDFWATYCKPCRKVLVELAELAQDRPDVVIVAVSQDEDPASLADYLSKLEAAPAIAIDPEQTATSGELAIARLPTQLVVDGDGVIRAVREGATGDLRADLDRLGL